MPVVDREPIRSMSTTSFRPTVEGEPVGVYEDLPTVSFDPTFPFEPQASIAGDDDKRPANEPANATADPAGPEEVIPVDAGGDGADLPPPPSINQQFDEPDPDNRKGYVPYDEFNVAIQEERDRLKEMRTGMKSFDIIDAPVDMKEPERKQAHRVFKARKACLDFKAHLFDSELSDEDSKLADLAEAGAALYVYKTGQVYNEQLRLRTTDPFKFDKVVKVDNFRHSGFLFAKLGELSLLDLAEGRSGRLIDKFRFLTASHASVIADIFDPSLPETGLVTVSEFMRRMEEVEDMQVLERPGIRELMNQNRNSLLIDSFPLMSQAAIMSACSINITAQAIPPNKRFSKVLGKLRVPPEAEKEAQDLIEKIKGLQDEIRDAVLDRNTNGKEEEREELIEAIATVLNDPLRSHFMLRNIGVFHSPNHTLSAYRRARRLQETSTKPDFYEKLADAIVRLSHEFWDEILGDDGTLVDLDDFDKVWTLPDEENLVGENTINNTWEAIRKKAGTMNGVTRVREYDINEPLLNKNIRWGNFTPADKIHVSFGERNTQQIVISLIWIDEETEERVSFALICDTRKALPDGFEWTVFDNPRHSVMKQRRDACISLLPSLLDHCIAQGQELKGTKKPTVSISADASVEEKKSPREHFKDEIYLLRKQLRSPGPLPDVQSTQEVGRSIYDTLIQKQIIIPEDDELRDLLSKLAPPDASKVIEAIAVFNDEGKGRFKRLITARGSEPLYELKINTEGGGVRILLVEVEQSDIGQRQFALLPEGIGYRNQIFSRAYKNKIDRMLR